MIVLIPLLSLSLLLEEEGSILLLTERAHVKQWGSALAII